jgi:hypothetical protein
VNAIGASDDVVPDQYDHTGHCTDDNGVGDRYPPAPVEKSARWLGCGPCSRCRLDASGNVRQFSRLALKMRRQGSVIDAFTTLSGTTSLVAITFRPRTKAIDLISSGHSNCINRSSIEGI